MDLKFAKEELLNIMKSNHQEMAIKMMHQMISHFREMEITEPQSGTNALMELVQMGHLKLSMYLSLVPAIENPYIPYQIIYS